MGDVIKVPKDLDSPGCVPHTGIQAVENQVMLSDRLLATAQKVPVDVVSEVAVQASCVEALTSPVPVATQLPI